MPDDETKDQEQQPGEPQAGPDDIDGLKKALEEQTARAEGFLNSWKRAQADLENYKKRAEQDKSDSSAYANAMLLSSLLPVLDDLERAFDTLDVSLAGLTWVEGLKLVYRKVFSTLESQGLRVIETIGQKFNPKFHEAVMHVAGEEGRVIGELQKGYIFRDRVLRPAMVKVGNGKSARQADADSTGSGRAPSQDSGETEADERPENA